MWVLDCEEGWVLKNWCFWTVVLEKTLESPLDYKEIQPVHSEGDQSWGSLEGMMLKLKLQYFAHLMWRVDSLENLWCWEGLGAGREGDDQGWDGWMASPTRRTLVWVNSKSWWWTMRPDLLQYMGSQRVRHDWATELNSIEFNRSMFLKGIENCIIWPTQFFCPGIINKLWLPSVSLNYRSVSVVPRK